MSRLRKKAKVVNDMRADCRLVVTQLLVQVPMSGFPRIDYLDPHGHN